MSSVGSRSPSRSKKVRGRFFFPRRSLFSTFQVPTCSQGYGLPVRSAIYPRYRGFSNPALDRWEGEGKKCAAQARNAMGTSSGLSAYTFPLFFLCLFFPPSPASHTSPLPKNRRSKDCEIFTDDVNYRLLLLLLLPE